MKDMNRLAAQRLPLLNRQRPTERRTGAPAGSLEQQVGDAFWKPGVEIAKVIYSRIDARYPYHLRQSDKTIEHEHQVKMDEARKILNENRNEVLEAVMPLFNVRHRRHDEAAGEADLHAHQYIVTNLFDTMVSTWKAWADQFVEPSEVEALERTIDKVAAIQRERCAGLLQNFRFEFVDISVKAR